PVDIYAGSIVGANNRYPGEVDNGAGEGVEIQLTRSDEHCVVVRFDHQSICCSAAASEILALDRGAAAARRSAPGCVAPRMQNDQARSTRSKTHHRAAADDTGAVRFA